MEPETKKSKGYVMYALTFMSLTVLTLIAVGLTLVRLSPAVTIGLILLIATLQAAIVLIFNMHLKFHDKILMLFTGIVFSLILFTILGTLLDYINR